MGVTILCVAEGRGDRWEAFCLNFDLAVQGRSFPEVQEKLNDQIHLYLESVCAIQDEAEQKRLLNRRVPLHLRAYWTSKAFISILLSSRLAERHAIFPADGYKMAA